jgi:hypothetical protein
MRRETPPKAALIVVCRSCKYAGQDFANAKTPPLRLRFDRIAATDFASIAVLHRSFLSQDAFFAAGSTA